MAVTHIIIGSDKPQFFWFWINYQHYKHKMLGSCIKCRNKVKWTGKGLTRRNRVTGCIAMAKFGISKRKRMCSFQPHQFTNLPIVQVTKPTITYKQYLVHTNINKRYFTSTFLFENSCKHKHLYKTTAARYLGNIVWRAGPKTCTSRNLSLFWSGSDATSEQEVGLWRYRNTFTCKYCPV